VTNEPTSEFLQLWPILIMRRRFPKHEESKGDLLRFVEEYMAANPKSRIASENRNLYESEYGIIPKYYDQNIGLKNLTDFFVESFREISTAANVTAWHDKGLDTDKFAVQITASWFINYLDGGNVEPHVHGNSSWSCSYYLQLGDTKDAKDGGTYLLSPLKQKSHDLGDLYIENTRFDTRAEEGFTLFFPSFLLHGSYPHRGADPRIIFSCNAEVVG